MYKDFDLERAKKGDPVVFKSEINGLEFRDARILCFDRKSRDDRFPIIALIGVNDEERSGLFDKNGSDPSGYPRLFMAPVKRQAWTNVFQTPSGTIFTSGGCYNSLEEAKKAIMGASNHVKTMLVHEWEE